MSVYWQGKELPKAKPDHVWAIKMWPGGRKILNQQLIDSMHNSWDAVERLQHGHCANVWLDDVTLVIALLPDDHPLKRKS